MSLAEKVRALADVWRQRADRYKRHAKEAGEGSPIRRAFESDATTYEIGALELDALVATEPASEYATTET